MGNSFMKRKQSENHENLLENSKIVKNNETHHKEYFKLVKLKLRKFYEENLHNQFNISISLDKKDFSTVMTSKKVCLNPSQRFVYWKDYLIEYLEKQREKGVPWAIDLIDLIKSEIFLSENKWLSLFFWQEFEMRTKPKCLVNYQKNLDKDVTYDSNNSDNYCITDRLNGSFVSINTDSLSVNDPTHEYKEYRNKVKSYIAIFKDHVLNKDHPINTVARYFIRTFSSFIKEKIKELYMLRNSNDPDFAATATITTDLITKSIQKFILKLQTSLRLMYSKTINYQCFIEEKDEFINLITNLMFRDGLLYEHMYELFQISLFYQLKVLENKLGELKIIKPDDLGTHAKFCLTRTTLDYQKKILEESSVKSRDNKIGKSSISISIAESNKLKDDQKIKEQVFCEMNDFNEFSPNSNVTMKLNIQESIASHDVLSAGDHSARLDVKVETPSSKKELKIYSESEIFSHSIKKKIKPETSERLEKIKYSQGPYEQAIKLLKSIKRYKVPFEKMMLIATISSEITDCVNNFWKNFEKIITSSLLNIDADELMTIFIYIIIKSQMAELLVHTKFVKEFTTSTTRSSMMGYYFTTLEASLIYILSVKDKSELLNKDKMRQSLIPSKSSFLFNENEEFTVTAINNSSHNNKNFLSNNLDY